jgi:hypothetical protein
VRLPKRSISGAGRSSRSLGDRRSGRSLDGSSFGRIALGGRLRDNHALAAAVAAGATAGNNLAADDFTAAAARTTFRHNLAAPAAAVRDDRAAAAAAIRGNRTAAAAAVRGNRTAARRLTGTALDGRFLAMATVPTATEEPMALLTAVASVVTGKQTAVATTAMAAVAGHRTRVTANEGDGDQGEKHRKRKTEKPLHQKPPTGGNPNAAVASNKPSRREPRSGTATGPQQPMFHDPPPERAQKLGKHAGWAACADSGKPAVRLSGEHSMSRNMGKIRRNYRFHGVCGASKTAG